MLALIIITFGILSRLVVHTPNFTPVLSVAFLAGMYLKGRQSVLVPVGLMVISDFILGLYPLCWVTWIVILLISLLGLYYRERRNAVNVISGSIFSALLFFVITNLASWYSMYPHTWDGLHQCYVLAIPFFRSSLASTVAYSVIFYAGYEWILKHSQGTVLARLV